MSTTTGNMGLLIPTPGDSDYPTSLNSTINAIDTHDHSSGEGVQIPTAGITDLAVTTGKLAASAVTTAKILDGAVTQAKRAALGQQISSVCTLFSSISTTPADVTNLTVTITSTGRPIFVGIIPDVPGVGQDSVFGASPGGAGTATAYFDILEDGVSVARTRVTFESTDTDYSVFAVPATFFTIRPNSAGTYTYKLQMYTTAISGNEAFLTFCKMVAYEL